MSLDQGVYKANIQKVTLGETKTGKPQIVYEVILDSIQQSDGEFAPCPHLARTIYRVITDNTIDYALDDLRELGYDRATFADIDPESPNAFDFDGIEVTVEMKLEMYEGRQTERWNFTRKGAGKKLEASAVSKLDAMFGAKLKAGRADTGTRAPVVRPARVANTKPGGNADNGVPKDENGEEYF
jgi:hypothetical protein